MANIITAAEFQEHTGVTAEEIGEEDNSTAIRDREIAKAQIEFFRDASRTFVATDDDYTLAQEAVAFLTAHKISTMKKALVGEEEKVSPYLKEYQRVLGLITKGQGTPEQSSFQAGLELAVSQEDSADYVEDMPDE